MQFPIITTHVTELNYKEESDHKMAAGYNDLFYENSIVNRKKNNWNLLNLDFFSYSLYPDRESRKQLREYT